MDKNKTDKPKKTRQPNYEKPLKIKGTFMEAINELVNRPKDKPKNKE